VPKCEGTICISLPLTPKSVGSSPALPVVYYRSYALVQRDSMLTLRHRYYVNGERQASSLGREHWLNVVTMSDNGLARGAREPPSNPSTDPTHHHPKRHPDPISRFATVHFQTDRQDTYIPTDGLGDRSTPLALTLYYTDKERSTR